MKVNREQLLENLKKHISYVQGRIRESMKVPQEQADMDVRAIARLRSEDRPVAMQIKVNAMQRVEDLKTLFGSPYFVKCSVILHRTGEHKTYYFAKHHFSDESIYSWLSPVSTIRFETPGEVSYRLPDGEVYGLTLVQKDQYMIVDGKVLFFSTESKGSPRELVYQEHFTQQKSGFILPEIVAQMEKAQDQVVRAEHKGPLLITGPAGSGKTTLALHRVAYLTQAPDTAPSFPEKSIAVFVQDNGTKEYFSHLLPGLGINNVHITTFSEWAMEMLKLEGYAYIPRYGENEEEMDQFEYQKIKALRGSSLPVFNRNCFLILGKAYHPFMTKESEKIFARQKKEKKLDRFDLTIILKSYLEKYKKLETQREVIVASKGISRTKILKNKITYSLIVVDEFQNYLPEQLSILKHCINEDTGAMLYVGDMAQQVYLGTIKDWTSIKEVILPERNVRLDKVYRNTKNILSYIESLGYRISLPEGLKGGPVVTEKVFETVEQEISYIEQLIPKYKEGSIGILSKSDAYLEPFRKRFACHKNVHALTMIDSQGVEFDMVCVVGITKDTFATKIHFDALPAHLEERRLMQKDLLYVALTRAITELHVTGRNRLTDCMNPE